jgi:hypothetical protein
MQLQQKNWTLTPARAGKDTMFGEASQFLEFQPQIEGRSDFSLSFVPKIRGLLTSECQRVCGGQVQQSPVRLCWECGRAVTSSLFPT